MGFLKKRTEQREEAAKEQKRDNHRAQIRNFEQSAKLNQEQGNQADAEDSRFLAEVMKGMLISVDWTSQQEELSGISEEMGDVGLVEGRLSMDLWLWSWYWGLRHKISEGRATDKGVQNKDVAWQRCIDYFGESSVMPCAEAVEKGITEGRQVMSAAGDRIPLKDDVAAKLRQVFGADADHILKFQWMQVDYFSSDPVPERREWLLRLAAWGHGHG
jgi:hypothetical protein